MKVNDVFITKNCGKIKILEVNGCKNIKVIFADTGFITNAEAGNIRKGVVRDLLAKKTFGVGYVGVGDYKPSINRKHTRQYQAWKGMIQRCYSEVWHKRHKSYTGCSVCEEWHNFQVFAKWFDENYIEGFELDKDTLIAGNKVYSPSTCVFISKKENTTSAVSKEWVVSDVFGGERVIKNLKRFCLVYDFDYQKVRSTVNSGGKVDFDLSKFLYDGDL